MQLLFVPALLLMLPGAWAQTAEHLPLYDIRVNIQPELRKLSVDANVTLPAAATARQAAGRENQWPIDQWLNQKGLPVLDLKWTADKNEITVEISQQQPGMPLYRFKLPVRLFYTDGSAEMRNVDVAAQAQSKAVLPIGKAVSRVELDPEHTMLCPVPTGFRPFSRT